MKLLVWGLPLLIACGAREAAHEPAAQSEPGYAVEVVAENLTVPWEIVFDPSGRMLFTERPGRVRAIENGRLREEPLFVVPDVQPSGESGLMGLCLHPDYAKNRWVYLSYADRSRNVRVMRYRETESGFVEPTVILQEIPAASLHAGCSIDFGPDGKLYVTTGDAGRRQLSQDLGSIAGKTLRLNDDGSIPVDNPFVGREGVRGEIWSYGHRNAQGMDWQPGTGLMFQTEHGPSGFDGPGGGDEVNIVERGRDYGWPTVHHEKSQEGMVDPLLVMTPAQAPASGAFYRGDRLAQFKNDYFFGCLIGRGLMRLKLDGRKLISHEKMLTEYGRCRAVASGPDGALYFATSNRDGRGSPAQNDDRILRLVPKK